MKRLRIYIDTSVIGGCCDAEFARWSNGLLADFVAGHYRAVISEIVQAEIEDAPDVVLKKYMELVNTGPEVLRMTPKSAELAQMYISQKILSENFTDDARHIALATVAGVDVLVSWNFKHIVHFDKIRLFNAVNKKHGYPMISIYSPREVAHYESQSS